MDLGGVSDDTARGFYPDEELNLNINLPVNGITNTIQYNVLNPPSNFPGTLPLTVIWDHNLTGISKVYIQDAYSNIALNGSTTYLDYPPAGLNNSLTIRYGTFENIYGGLSAQSLYLNWFRIRTPPPNSILPIANTIN